MHYATTPLILFSVASAAAQTRLGLRCFVDFDTCQFPVPAELKNKMAAAFGKRAGCTKAEVVYHGAPNSTIEGLNCDPVAVKAIGSKWVHTFDTGIEICFVRCL